MALAAAALTCLRDSRSIAAGTGAGVLICVVAVGLSLGAENDILGYLVGRYFDLRWFGQVYGVLFGTYLLGAALGPCLMARAWVHAGSYDVALRVGAAAIVVWGRLALDATMPWGRAPEFERKRIPGEDAVDLARYLRS